MWTFSKHAKIRIVERGYTSDEILKVLNEKIPSLVLESPRENSVDLYFSRIGKKHVLIVVDRISHNIITVRPMKRKEINEYKKQMEKK